MAAYFELKVHVYHQHMTNIIKKFTFQNARELTDPCHSARKTVPNEPEDNFHEKHKTMMTHIHNSRGIRK